jgi:hypothetical protein
MTPDWRNALLITGASLAIGSGYMLLPNEDAVVSSARQGYQVVYQCDTNCPNRFQDGVSWPILPLSLGFGVAASGALAWYRSRRASSTDAHSAGQS